MNIGIIHGFVGGGGGTEKTLLTILDALEETNHKVTLYTFSKPKLALKKIIVKSVIPISIPVFGLYQRLMESKLVEKAKHEDILIQTSGAINIPDNLKQKIIVYCHSDFSSELEKTITKYRGVWRKYYKIYYEKMKKSLEKIHQENVILISNSKYVQDLIEKTYGKKSLLLYPPLDLSEFNENKSKKNSLITVSRFSAEKNLEFVIDVIKNLPIDSIIIGNTKTKSNELYYDLVKSKIKKEMSFSRIILLKNISRKELLNHLLESKVYFHASPETFGLTIVESISAGCVPIVPNNSAHLETVPFPQLRYEPNNMSDAQEKIREAISGNFDDLIIPLKNSIQKYNKEQFKKSFVSIVDNSLN
ncbi:MAG: glycosyltransferase family 4 protein [Nitrosarchaeum sp.]|nr:glycosyltransferase family 4 protein [Nitrosarchaeum sp.]